MPISSAMDTTDPYKLRIFQYLFCLYEAINKKPKFFFLSFAVWTMYHMHTARVVSLTSKSNR